MSDGAAVQAELVRDSVDVLAKHGRSFSFASWFLPAGKRGDAAILYAFCRLADDEVDEADDAAMARDAVERLRAELLGDVPPRPLVAEVRRILAPVGLQPALDLLDGVYSDLDFRQPADDAALRQYCYRVAGTVGLMMCAVLGVHERWAWKHAVDLGIGMQLTNIARDVAEDAERGRLYLPASRLQVPPQQLQAHRDQVRQVVAALLDQADTFYASGRRGYAAIPLRSRVAIAVAARVYQGIGHRLRARGGDPLLGRTVVPGWRRVLLALRALPDALPRRNAPLALELVDEPDAAAWSAPPPR